MVNYKVNETGHSDKLKLEISYRTPAPNEETNIVNGIKVASVERLIDNKLNAAFDGENTRTKGRDLFDLHFLAKHYPDHFDEHSANRLKEFTQDSDSLFSQYEFNFKSDPLLGSKIDLETLVLDLHDMANELANRHDNSLCTTLTNVDYGRMEDLPEHLRNMIMSSLDTITRKVDFSEFVSEDKKEDDNNKLENVNQFKFKP